VPITFHDTDEIAHLGTAAFLQMAPPRPDDAHRYGALFIINARGEPLEFAYNRLELQHATLWRSLDREQAAIRRLAITLFEAVTLAPSLLICQADVVGPHIFGADGFTLSIPVLRLAPSHALTGYVGREAQETLETVDENGECQDVRLFWTPRPPEGPVATLFARLLERGLTLEPFARAQQGLAEVYGEQWSTEP
jgi:hypothetical protein